MGGEWGMSVKIGDGEQRNEHYCVRVCDFDSLNRMKDVPFSSSLRFHVWLCALPHLQLALHGPAALLLLPSQKCRPNVLHRQKIPLSHVELDKCVVYGSVVSCYVRGRCAGPFLLILNINPLPLIRVILGAGRHSCESLFLN